jgi:hypothetical protein
VPFSSCFCEVHSHALVQVQAHNIAQFQQFLSEPPASAVTLRLLLDLAELARLLNQITFLQLLHLTNNAIPPGTVAAVVAVDESVSRCGIMGSWRLET